MVVFIVPLQSPEVSKDWEFVSRLALRTLASLTAPGVDHSRVILVCNRRPNNFSQIEGVRLIEQTFSIPSRDNPRAGMEDKWAKVRRGLIEASQFFPAYVMVVDADDCISRRLSEYVSSAKKVTGWYCADGYMYEEGASFLTTHSHIHSICGSTSMVYCDNPIRSEEAAAESLICRFGHSTIVAEMQRRGTPLQALPFRAVVYIRGTSENHSGVSGKSRSAQLRNLFRTRRLSKARREEFSLRPLRS